jgi:hypothetical protein
MARPIGSRNIKWDKAELQRLYWEERINSHAIARQYGTVFQAVLKAMQRLGIPRRTHSEAGSKELHYRWQGGRWYTSGGYIMIYLPSHPRADRRGYIYEHIVVLEDKLRRKLKSREISHHLNGVKDDNRPINLVALTSQKHQQVLKAKAKRILELEIELERCLQQAMVLG